MATPEKVLPIDRLLAARAEAARLGRAVVQCHGCFDILHPGHIRHLREARSHGDILLVTITSDGAFTKRGGQPLIPQEHRADALAALDCVDLVAIDDHPTCAELLEAIRPDVYVKGREYETSRDARFLAERATVERHGGRVVFSSGDVVFSSTALIGELEHSADPALARVRQIIAEPELDGAALSALIGRFAGKRMLVVGETILDQYVRCDQPEVASESPVMTLRPLERRTFDGGAAIIARHMAALGARPTLLTGLPNSPQSEALRRRLAAEGVEVISVPIDCPIAEKQRFLVGPQKVMKVNNVLPIVL
ncbi:MAG: adenylyltransferase/cytidyltransferase family protein, partial [Phycisphaerales bacterium]